MSEEKYYKVSIDTEDAEVCLDAHVFFEGVIDSAVVSRTIDGIVKFYLYLKTEEDQFAYVMGSLEDAIAFLVAIRSFQSQTNLKTEEVKLTTGLLGPTEQGVA